MEFLTPNAFSYLMVSVILFTLGAIGVMTRRNAIVVFMCIELMLNAVNLALVTFSKMYGDPNGSMIVFFVMCVAAAEAVVGLSIIIALFRNKLDVDINQMNIFKW
jgi:NADH-quinone oxidoreductase subunit K